MIEQLTLSLHFHIGLHVSYWLFMFLHAGRDLENLFVHWFMHLHLYRLM